MHEWEWFVSSLYDCDEAKNYRLIFEESLSKPCLVEDGMST